MAPIMPTATSLEAENAVTIAKRLRRSPLARQGLPFLVRLMLGATKILGNGYGTLCTVGTARVVSMMRRMSGLANLRQQAPVTGNGGIRRSATTLFMANSIGPESVSSSSNPISGSWESTVAPLASNLLYPVLLGLRFILAVTALSDEKSAFAAVRQRLFDGYSTYQVREELSA